MAGDAHQPDQQFIDRLTDGLVALDRDLVITHHNQAAARLARHEGGVFVGRSLWEVFPQYRGSRLDGQFHHALADQEVLESEDYSALAQCWLWRRIYPGEDGVTLLFGESALPRASEVEIRSALTRSLDSERRYRNLLDGMAEGVAETTPDGRFLTVNRAFAGMLGYNSSEDLITSVANAAALYADPGQRPTHLARAAGGSWPIGEIEMLRKDGSHVWIRGRSSPQRDTSGEVASIQTIAEDLSQLRYSERELRQVSERIEERERALLAESVHDDPLQLIVAGLLRIDTLQKLLPPTQAESAEQIALMLEQAVERLRQLITALTPPDLTGGLGEALLQAAEGIFVGTSTMIHMVGPRHVPLTPAVKADCYRVLREAMVNARRHANAAHVTIKLKTDTDAVELSVTDDGDGTDDFNAGPGHLGVGLMRARAEGVMGRLHIESSPAHGTSVRLVVPKMSEGAPSANDPEPMGR